MDDIQATILDRLRGSGGGKAFTPKDFLDVGRRDAVDQALSRLVRKGDICRLGRGLYYYPRTNPRLGIAVQPDIDDIADALARKTGTRIAPSGATAANRLGLSTQVPAKPVYLTDGRSRRVQVGDTEIVIKHAAPKNLPIGSGISATVIQALRYIGRDAVTPEVVSRIRRKLSGTQKAQLRNDSRYIIDWIADTVRLIVNKEEEVVAHG